MPGKTPKKPRKRKRPEEKLEYLSLLSSEKGKPVSRSFYFGPPALVRGLEKSFIAMGRKQKTGKLQTARSTKGFVDLRNVKISEEEWKRIEEERRKRRKKKGNK